MNDEFKAGGEAPADDGGAQYWFIFLGDKLLVDEDLREPPGRQAADALDLTADGATFLGSYGGKPCYMAQVADGTPAPDGLAWHGLYGLVRSWAEPFIAMAGRAKQLMAFYHRNTVCGACGQAMRDVPGDRARQCPECGLIAYPRISPAVIMAVMKGGKVLLGRSPRFPKGRMSVLAGFVEPGENLEQCVAREIREEVGIEVTNIRYFGSQPWPFPDSLMIGFICDWAAGEIAIDNREIVEADWYGAGELPSIPPSSTIARQLINAALGLKPGEGPQGGWS